jgi:hypothetical protein
MFRLKSPTTRAPTSGPLVRPGNTGRSGWRRDALEGLGTEGDFRCDSITISPPGHALSRRVHPSKRSPSPSAVASEMGHSRLSRRKKDPETLAPDGRKSKHQRLR